MPDPHRDIRALAAKLEQEGVDPNDIVDALLVTGLNGGLRLGGRELVLHLLDRAVTLVCPGEPTPTMRH